MPQLVTFSNLTLFFESLITDKIIVISIMCSCTVQLYDFFKYNYPNMSSASVI